ncbi:MAG: site-specific DNA-methyltransferase [Verrucomicrobiales bacterium]|nr:site-specific DNA-methyltransferase [Verrucomicrobiales bacterium]
MPKKPSKQKPLYRRTLRLRQDDDLLWGTPITPAHFELRDDGTIAAQPRQATHAPELVFHDTQRKIWLYCGNCFELLDAIAAKYPEGRFDCIFADPPYFLSNGGITCHAGRMVKVDKGDWDKSRGPELNHQFNLEWLRRCQRVLKPNGTIWVTGTHHVIFSIGFAMQQLGFKILNAITWEKPNPPPNLSCRYFTHSTETIIWAAKTEKSRHTFNYAAMKAVTGKQMKTVWRKDEFWPDETRCQPVLSTDLSAKPSANASDETPNAYGATTTPTPDIWTIQAPGRDEKLLGKHPTQKPVALVERCLLASTNEGDLVLDPFLGSGTTAVACIRLKRGCVGIDMDAVWVRLAVRRIENEVIRIWLSEFRVRVEITVARAGAVPLGMGTGNARILSRSAHSAGDQYDLDLALDSINGSDRVDEKPQIQTDCIWRETKFVFLACGDATQAEVVHVAVDSSLDSAWAATPAQKKSETTHIVRCETQILRVKKG